jgi:hypothetical protein
VGRVLNPGGAASLRERCNPAMIRIANQHNGAAPENLCKSMPLASTRSVFDCVNRLSKPRTKS